jgi:cell division protein FtsX
MMMMMLLMMMMMMMMMMLLMMIMMMHRSAAMTCHHRIPAVRIQANLPPDVCAKHSEVSHEIRGAAQQVKHARAIALSAADLLQRQIQLPSLHMCERERERELINLTQLQTFCDYKVLN